MASTASSAGRRTSTAHRLRHLGRGRPALLALALFVILDLVYFGRGVIPHLASRYIGQVGSDPSSYMWFLAWWPHAILHGHNPFVTDRLFAPGRTNLGAVDLVPGPALLATPTTLLFGPVVSYNLWALLAPPLAAISTYGLCRELGARPAASWAGGQLVGFSPYMLGQLLGHLDLILVFPAPLAALLTVRLLRGRISFGPYVGLTGLLLAFDLACSLELTATLVGLGVCGLLLAAVLLGEERRSLARALPALIGAAGLAAVLGSPFLVYGLTGPTSAGFFVNYASTYSVDGLGPFVPTFLIRVGRGYFATVASAFRGNLAESEGYLGAGLTIAVVRYVATRWGRPPTRWLVALLVLIVLLMLGPHLLIAGQSTIPLPWTAIDSLPLIDHTAPARLASYGFLVVAVILARWLSAPGGVRRRALRWLLTIVGLAMLVPNVGSGRWRTPLATPAFFAGPHLRNVVPRDAVVLTLPFAQVSNGMLWQAQAGFRYRLADGYVGALLPAGYAQDLGTLSAPGASPTAAQLGAFLTARHVTRVIVDAAQAGTWPALLAQLGLHGTSVDGVVVYPVGAARAGRA